MGALDPMIPSEENAVAVAQAAGPALSEATFARIRDAIYSYAGIYFPGDQRPLFERRLISRLTQNHCADFEEYASTLGRRGAPEMHALLGLLAVNDTYFFRGPSQMRTIVQVVVPALARKGVGTPQEPIRMWSAACSTGEEPYSVGIMLFETWAQKMPCVRILGSDLNEELLARARLGVYGASALRETDAEMVGKYFVRRDGRYEILPAVRRLVEFRCVNLNDAGQVRAQAPMDIILCRNTLTCFDRQARRRCVEAFHGCLRPGGLLFLGEGESLNGLAPCFRLAFLPGAMAYARA